MINSNFSHPTSFAAMIKGLRCNRQLIMQMAKREVIGRYKGSIMGILWSFINPLFMLAVYTFVFSAVFKSRWGMTTSETKTQFAIVLFVGMIIYNFFTEVINRAPSLIVSNVNFVKKVVFPLDIIPVVAMCAALFHALISVSVFMVAFVVLNAYLNWTIIFIPVVILPCIILTLGFAWMLASLGVFFRDLGQTTAIFTMAILFLSPVFYPVTALPEMLRPYIMANPLTFIIEQAREVLIWGNCPNWLGLGTYTAVSIAVAWLGYAWFQKTRKGFADVL